ncbi:hypothetical protein D5086_003793 [Populus alba]|uniref:Uncharacterized protein n=1 Tax=Populus alba TaxID=43335 RepID=A0ACC4D5B9_POPAL
MMQPPVDTMIVLPCFKDWTHGFKESVSDKEFYNAWEKVFRMDDDVRKSWEDNGHLTLSCGPTWCPIKLYS